MAQTAGRLQSGAGLARGPARLQGFSAELGWFAAVAGIAFLVPFVFSSTLELHHDLYYLVYFATTLLVLGAYLRAHDVDVREVFARNLRLSLAAGALAAAFVVWSVLARVESTPHPTGLYYAFEIAWRGVFYGVVDGLLLSAFPGLVAWRLMHGNIVGVGRRIGYGVLTLALVFIVTATYHFGYEDLQSREGITGPEIGNTVISLPVVISANPAGSIIAHTSMHLAAVTHSYESKDRLPPQVFVDSGE